MIVYLKALNITTFKNAKIIFFLLKGETAQTPYVKCHVRDTKSIPSSFPAVGQKLHHPKNYSIGILKLDSEFQFFKEKSVL